MVSRIDPSKHISQHLASVLPPGTPSMHLQMEDATFTGTGRARIATARLTMLDGLTATVEVFGFGYGCFGHRWKDWQGPDLYFQGGEWRRDESAQRSFIQDLSTSFRHRTNDAERATPRADIVTGGGAEWTQPLRDVTERSA